ncbi:MAG: replication initiator protein A [Sphingomonas sp.]
MAATDQTDLFDLDSPLYSDVHGERTVAEFPFFALAKTPQMEPMVFQSEDVRIEVSPSPIGIATIYDKEVLLYIAGLMAEKLERGEPVEHEMSFTAHDFFRATGANASVKSYTSLKRSLRRLQGTEILTNIETGGEGEEGGFSWLLTWNTTYARGADGNKRLKAVRIRLCDWLYRAILKDRRIAAYHDDFFRLGPVERRLYELAMFNCGGETGYEAGLERLALKVGCSASPRSLAKFKRQLRDIAESDTLPQYRVELRETRTPSANGRPRIDTSVLLLPRHDDEEDETPVPDDDTADEGAPDDLDDPAVA